ncbi:transglycosylase domain-containing protein [Marispirochaeta sp.]|uniref:transglycosylase domain-containing protein n=1 Tax=Marispirochaeta sp. TaxID=2038653 RepID=UPI0029C98EA6|nr:transglycosylase domain-containing protein [Marispirochaeta sp.]
MSERALFRLIILPWICIGIAGVLTGLSLLVPFPELEQARSGPWSLRVIDRDGGLLQVLPVDASGLRREYRSRELIPDYLVSILVTGEDSRFFLHPGIDPVAVLRAAAANISAGRIVSGASTISMQLARRVAPGGAGFRSKLLESWNALRIEARMSKAEILELWLNSLPMGSNVEGVVSAAREYFYRDIQALTPGESAFLALIPRNPGRHDPRKGGDAAAAANLLQRAGIQGNQGEPAISAAQSPWPFKAPHFVRYLVSRYHADGTGPVRTSMDQKVQELLHAEIAARVESAADNRISNGSGVVLSVETGEILAYVGSADFFNAETQGQIDGVQIQRQPGSTIKPFLYALALERGMTPASLLPDIPSAFGSEAVYLPENFSNTFHGPVRLRVALASSLNIPAVHTVVHTGVSDFAGWLLDLGFDSLTGQRDFVGAGIALGNAEVTLLELVTAFSIFQRDGFYIPATFLVDTRRSSGKPVMDRETAFLIRDILSVESGRITGFGTGSILNTPFPAMFKTGTSNQFNNIWALGATEKTAVGIWMGNFSGETVIGRPGSSVPASAAVAILTALQEIPAYRVSQRKPELPAGITACRICSLSGGRVGPYCPGSVEEFFRTGTEPEFCSVHRQNGIYMPSEYRSWGEQRGLPWKYTPSGDMRILSPTDGAVFYLDTALPEESQTLRIQAEGRGPLLLKLNGELQSAGTGSISVRVPLERGAHRITLESEDRRIESGFTVR